MIQKLTADYFIALLIGYVKGGIVGWCVWFVLALAYVLWSFKFNMELYKTDEKGGKKPKLSLRGFLTLIFWPWGMMEMTHELVKHVRAELYGKE